MITKSVIELFAEVKIIGNTKNGEHGTVLGISENDNGEISGYAVMLHGADTLTMFDKEDVAPTGKMFSESDYY